MPQRFVTLAAAIALGSSSALSACAAPRVYSVAAQLAPVRTLAVAPMRNWSDRDEAAQVLSERILTALYAYTSDVQVIDATATEPPASRTQVQALGRAHAADAVLVATALEYEHIQSSGGSGQAAQTPAIAIRAQLVSSNEGAVLWSALVAQDGTDLLSTEQTPLESLAQEVAESMVASLIGTIARSQTPTGAAAMPEKIDAPDAIEPTHLSDAKPDAITGAVRLEQQP